MGKGSYRLVLHIGVGITIKNSCVKASQALGGRNKDCKLNFPTISTQGRAVKIS